MDLGTALGRELGIPDRTIDAVADWRSSTELTDEQRLVVEYAEQLSMTPANVTDEVYERLRAGFSERQIVELTNLIAWENARARFNRGFRVEPDGYVTD